MMELKEAREIYKSCHTKIRGSEWENHFKEVDRIDQKNLNDRIKKLIP